MSELAIIPRGQLPAALADDVQAARDFAKAEKAGSTRRAYKSDFAIFRSWCRSRSLVELPASPETVATFIASEARAGVKPSTIGRRLASIRYAHQLAGHEAPTTAEPVRKVMRGIRRSIGVTKRKKEPATSDKLLAMVALAPNTMAGLRERALLLIGFGGAFRRSEVVRLDLADVIECDAGLKVTIRRSKTDQEGEGQVVGIVRGSVACPMAAVHAWIRAAGLTEGPLFRAVNKAGKVGTARLSDKSVALIVKRYSAKVGFRADDFAGHSLRSGFLTSASCRGSNIFRMRDQSRHKSIETLAGYVRESELFKDHPGDTLL